LTKNIGLHIGPSEFPFPALVTTESLRANMSFEFIIALWDVTPSFRRYVLPPSAEFTELLPGRHRSDWGGGVEGVWTNTYPSPITLVSIGHILALRLTNIIDPLPAIFTCRKAICHLNITVLWTTRYTGTVHRLHSSRVASGSLFFCLTSAVGYTTVTRQASQTKTVRYIFSLQFYNWARWSRPPHQHQDEFNKLPSLTSWKVDRHSKWTVNIILKSVWHQWHCRIGRNSRNFKYETLHTIYSATQYT
jgi:hypothetical protein